MSTSTTFTRQHLIKKKVMLNRKDIPHFIIIYAIVSGNNVGIVQFQNRHRLKNDQMQTSIYIMRDLKCFVHNDNTD